MAQQASSKKPDTTVDSPLIESMRKMHASMAATPLSGNEDVDFVRFMIPHHQAAIDMAKAELSKGKDPQLRRLAQQIITDQQSEIRVDEPMAHETSVILAQGEMTMNGMRFLDWKGSRFWLRLPLWPNQSRKAVLSITSSLPSPRTPR
jgi:hypothetical protein